MKKLLLLALACVFVCAVAGTVNAAASGLPVVYLQNDSTVIPQDEFVAEVAALQIAVSRDYAASWGTDAILTTDPSVPHQDVVDIEDDATCDGCLGYHDIVGRIPTAYVFAATSAEYGEAESLVTSHELFEMLVDPWINRFARWHRKQWLVETADPVEDGSFAYFINDVAISDFITPAWYGGVSGPKDFTRGLHKAGQIGVHGYASWLNTDGTWGQVFNFKAWEIR